MINKWAEEEDSDRVAVPGAKAPAQAPVPTAPAKSNAPEQSDDRVAVPTATSPASRDVVTPQGGHGNVQKQEVPKSVTQVFPGFIAVKQMQQAILDFAKTVAGVEMFQKSPTGTGNQETGMGEYLGGHDPFSSFLFRNYLDKPSDKPGTQYQDVDLPHGVRGDAALKQSETDSMRGWVSSMMHIGTASTGGENKPDGKWGERTTNALKNILSFAKAIISFAKEMGVQLGEYGDLSDFEKRIPQVVNGKVHINNVEEDAKVLTSHITTLKGLFEKFKNTVLSVPQWAKIMSQEAPALGGKQKPLSTAESYAMKHNSASLVNLGPKTNEYNLTLADLSNPEKFKAFLGRVKIPASTPSEISQAIANLMSLVQQPLGF